jgi:hypothetical protein
MQISTLLSVLLSSTLVFSTPIAKRDTAKVLSDFAMITRNVQHLSGDLASFVATPSGGIVTFSQHFSDLNTHLAQTTTDTSAVPFFDVADSESIATAAGNFEQAAVPFLVALINDVRP